MIDTAFLEFRYKLRKIVARAGEELFPFITYFINWTHLQATMNSDNPPAPPDTLANYRELAVSDLEKSILEEHERSKLLDEKTFKMTLSLALGLTILGSVTAVLLRNVGESTIATLMRFGLALSIFYIFVGGSIALSSLRTLPTFGYGTGFKIDVKRANAPVEVYIDALLRQEKANQIRQVRNEAAFQALRNGFVLFGIVLILYFLVLAGIIHAGLPIAL